MRGRKGGGRSLKRKGWKGRWRGLGEERGVGKVEGTWGLEKKKGDGRREGKKLRVQIRLGKVKRNRSEIGERRK